MAMAVPAGNVGGSCRQLPAVYFLFHLVFILLLGVSAEAEAAASFSFTNACAHPVWVGATHTSPHLSSSGFYLASGATSALAAPSSTPWSGTFWARTGCATNAATGRFSCATADCGSGDVVCDGRGPSPPVTLAEVTLSSSSGGLDFYDVSLVDGFNVPLSIAPSHQGCHAAACAGNVNAVCPADLCVVSGSSGATVACKSARYCCSGDYGTPAACGPTNYSQVFKTTPASPSPAPAPPPIKSHSALPPD